MIILTLIYSLGSRIMLLRIVPQNLYAYNTLQRTSGDQVKVSWINNSLSDDTKWCPICTIQPKLIEPLLMATPKNSSNVSVQLLYALKKYWQEKNASGHDNYCAREWQHLGTKNLTIALTEAHHFNVCKSISVEEIAKFLSSKSVGSS